MSYHATKFDVERKRKIQVLSQIFPNFPLCMIGCLLMRNDGDEKEVIRFLIIRGWEANQFHLQAFADTLDLVHDIHYTTRYYHGRYNSDLWTILRDYGSGAFMVCYCEENDLLDNNHNTPFFGSSNSSPELSGLLRKQEPQKSPLQMRRVSFAGVPGTIESITEVTASRGYYLISNQEGKRSFIKLWCLKPAILKDQIKHLILEENLNLCTPVLRMVASASASFISNLQEENETSCSTSSSPRFDNESYREPSKAVVTKRTDDCETQGKTVGFMCFAEETLSKSNLYKTYNPEDKNSGIIIPAKKLYIPSNLPVDDKKEKNERIKNTEDVLNLPEDFAFLHRLNYGYLLETNQTLHKSKKKHFINLLVESGIMKRRKSTQKD